jgi:phenylacetate-CoA ligase
MFYSEETLKTIVSIASAIRIAPSYARLARSQYWDKPALEIHAQRRIEEILRAAAQIPFYRERLAGKSSELSSYPTLKRSDIATLNASVRKSMAAGRKFFHDNSSGSTGMPVEFLFDNAHQTGRYAARIRYLRANGWHPMKRCAWIVATTSDDRSNPDSALMKSRLRLRANFLPVIFRPFDEQVDALRAARPEFLYTMPSNLDGLLQAFERRALRLDSLKLIFTGAEVLEDSLRERAGRILGVEIRDNYGSTEGFISWQCPLGTYHVNAEHMRIEMVDERGHPVAAGQMGRVLLTTLENRLMPLIRYEIGDYAIASNDACRCGRSLPVMGKVIGRGINLFRLPGGGLISPWPLVGPLKSRPAIRQFQIVQETHHHYRVRFVSDHDLDREAQQDIGARFSTILGIEATVSFERVDAIARTAGGKFMTALSLLSA